PQPLDLGQDCYAAVSFSGVEGDPVRMGWMTSGDYAGQTPTDPWRSAMTLPRTLHLEPAGVGHQLIQHLAVPDSVRTVDLGAVGPETEPVRLDAEEPFRVRGTLGLRSPQRVVPRFGEEPTAPELVLAVDAEGRVVLDRSAAHDMEFAPDHGSSAPYTPVDGAEEIAFDLVIDRSCVDLELDRGRALV